MTNIPTPRTFEAIEEYRKYGGSPRNEPVFSSDMFALEEELTTVTEQRDRLAETLRKCILWAECMSDRCERDRDNINWTYLNEAKEALQSTTNQND